MNDGFWLIAGIALLFVSQTQELAVAEADGGFISSGGGAPAPSVLAKILGGLGLNGVNGGGAVNGTPVSVIADEGAPVEGPGTFWATILDALGLGESDRDVPGGDMATTGGDMANGDAMGPWQGPRQDVYDPVQVDLVARTGGGYSIEGDPTELELLAADPTQGLILSGWGGPLGADINFPQGIDVLRESLLQHGLPINGDDGDDPNGILYDPVQVDLVGKGGGSYSITGSPEELELLAADPTRGVVVSGWGGPLGAPVNFPQGIAVLTESLIQHGLPIGGDDS